MTRCEEFLKVLAGKEAFQEKHLKKFSLDGKRSGEFEDFLRFCLRDLGESDDSLAESYMALNSMILQETYFFKRNGRYRHSKLEEVASDVYANDDYMKKYMMGLAISDYLWPQHMELIDYFESSLTGMGGTYLEIGPGCGQLLSRAIRSGRFTSYSACDLSRTSADLCNRYLRWCGYQDLCRVRIEDFMTWDSDQKFDSVVMGEVLEHVEDPRGMLVKIADLLSTGGKAYISTVINAPAIDHIYLFSDIKEVTDLFEDVGFRIDDYCCACIGGEKQEKALKRKDAITIALNLSK